MARTASSNKSSVRENSPRRRFRVFQAGRVYGVENHAIAPCARDDFKLAVSDKCFAHPSYALSVGGVAPEPGGRLHRQTDCGFDDLPGNSVGARECP
jgi:hypothetical protein